MIRHMKPFGCATTWLITLRIASCQAMADAIQTFEAPKPNTLEECLMITLFRRDGDVERSSRGISKRVAQLGAHSLSGRLGHSVPRPRNRCDGGDRKRDQPRTASATTLPEP